MNPSQLSPDTALLASAVGGHAATRESRYVRIAEIEIDPAQMESYKKAAGEEIETSVRVEPGVLALHAVAERENPARIVVFEMYIDVDAYRAHLQTPHFKKYKAVTRSMVRSVKLIDTVPVVLGAKLK